MLPTTTHLQIFKPRRKKVEPNTRKRRVRPSSHSSNHRTFQSKHSFPDLQYLFQPTSLTHLSLICLITHNQTYESLATTRTQDKSSTIIISSHQQEGSHRCVRLTLHTHFPIRLFAYSTTILFAYDTISPDIPKYELTVLYCTLSLFDD